MNLKPKTLGISRKCPQCGRQFFVCQSCWRGHWYCGAPCRQQARGQSRRRANKKYRLQENGRIKQRQAQDRYRKRTQQKNVRDHSSTKLETSIKEPSLKLSRQEDSCEAHSRQCISCGAIIHSLIDGRRFPRAKRLKGRSRRCYRLKSKPRSSGCTMPST